MATQRPTISQTELDVLKVLWEHGPDTIREIHAVLQDQGRSWAYTTVSTLLQRLEAKGYVRSDKAGLAHTFRAAVSRERLLRQRLADLADQLCEGTATPLVQALVEGHQFTAQEIEHFRRMLDDLEHKS